MTQTSFRRRYMPPELAELAVKVKAAGGVIDTDELKRVHDALHASRQFRQWCREANVKYKSAIVRLRQRDKSMSYRFTVPEPFVLETVARHEPMQVCKECGVEKVYAAFQNDWRSGKPMATCMECVQRKRVVKMVAEGHFRADAPSMLRIEAEQANEKQEEPAVEETAEQEVFVSEMDMLLDELYGRVPSVAAKLRKVTEGEYSREVDRWIAARDILAPYRLFKAWVDAMGLGYNAVNTAIHKEKVERFDTEARETIADAKATYDRVQEYVDRQRAAQAEPEGEAESEPAPVYERYEEQGEPMEPAPMITAQTVKSAASTLSEMAREIAEIQRGRAESVVAVNPTPARGGLGEMSVNEWLDLGEEGTAIVSGATLFILASRSRIWVRSLTGTGIRESLDSNVVRALSGERRGEVYY